MFVIQEIYIIGVESEFGSSICKSELGITFGHEVLVIFNISENKNCFFLFWSKSIEIDTLILNVLVCFAHLFCIIPLI